MEPIPIPPAGAQRSSDRKPRWKLAAVIATTAVAGVVIAAASQVYDVQRPQLLQGTAWLTSTEVGEVALVDGLSYETAARVEVAQSGSNLTWVGAGVAGYVLDHHDGTLTRIDRATQRPAASMRILGTQGFPPSAFATRDVVFALGKESGRLQAAEPHALAPQGDTVEVPKHLQATATGVGTLWLLDSDTGDLSWFTGGTARRHLLKRGGPRQGALVTTADDYPVVIPPTTGAAQLLDPINGHVRRSITVERRAGDVIVGSRVHQGLIIVRPTDHIVQICRFGEAACRQPIYLDPKATELGTPVETADHLIVPDISNGAAIIVDLAVGAVTAQPKLFPSETSYELMISDEIVFYNDPRSERAGVIHLDGQVSPIRKYVPNGAKPRATESVSTQPTARASRISSSVRPSVTPTRGGSAFPSTTGSRLPKSLRIVRFDINPNPPQTRQVVHFAAEVAGGRPDSWSWLVTGADHTVEVQTGEAEFTHTFTTAGSYTVSLTVRVGSSNAQLSQPLTVWPAGPPVQCGDSLTQSAILQSDLVCPGSGVFIAADDVVFDLGGHTILGSAAGTGVAIGSPGHKNVTIRNGEVRGFGELLNLGRSDGARVINMRLNSGSLELRYTRLLTIQGGEMSDVSARLLQSFEFVISGVAGRGVSLNCGWNCGGSRISDNVLSDSGVSIADSGLVEISNNRLEGHSLGITLGPECDAVIDHNTIRGAGISVFSNCPTLTVTDNIVTGGEYGFYFKQHILALTDLRISGNTFASNRKAGVYIDAVSSVSPRNIAISHNTVRNNGHDADGVVDSVGNPVDDGIHIAVPLNSGITLSHNTASSNEDFGIEALPGTVSDGSGNSSTGDPSGCLGVVCS